MKRNVIYFGGIVALVWVVAAQTWVSAARNGFVEEARSRYETVVKIITSLPIPDQRVDHLEQTLSAFLEKDPALLGVVWEGGGQRFALGRSQRDIPVAGKPRGIRFEYTLKGGGVLSGTLAFSYSEDALNHDVRGLRVRLYAASALILALLAGLVYMLWRWRVQQPLNAFVSEISRFMPVESADSGHGDGDLLATITAMLEREMADVRDARNKVAALAARLREEGLKAGKIFEALSVDEQGEVRALAQAGQFVSDLDASQRDVHESAEMLAALFDENVASVLEMRSSMGEIASSADELYQSTERAYASVSSIAESSRNISSGMSVLSETVDSTITALEEVSASVRSVETSARDAATGAAEVSERASGMGMAAVRETREGMAKIEHEVSASAAIMDRLGKRSKDITKVLGVIREVTEQTNLLSLNAAILAAQAGDQGRAFGVVADEIASLAERTAGSTQEISVIVTAIQKEIADAIHSTARGMSRVQEGGVLVGRTEEALSEMLEHARRSSDMALNIQRATEEQGEAIRYIGQSVSAIQDKAHQMTGAIAIQREGLSPLTGHVGTVRSVVEMIRKGVREQHEGVRSISENMQHTNEKLSQIAGATSPDKTSAPRLALVFEDVNRLNARNQQALKSLGEQLRNLSRLADELLESTGRYAK